jgi:hypothetical protein
MHAGEHILHTGNVAEHQRNVFAGVNIIPEPQNSPRAEIGWQLCISHTMHEPFVFESVRNKLSNGYHNEPVFEREFLQLRSAGCASIIIVQDFAGNAGRPQPGEARKVDSCLCVANYLEHAARPRAKRLYMSWPAEVSRG